MRQRFDLDVRELNRFTILFHGGYGVGKTFILGDMLRYESRKPPYSESDICSDKPVRYLNIAGEDGQLSIANFGLGEIGETVDTLADFEDAMSDYKKMNLRALAIDGGKPFGKLIVKAVCGDRLPSVGGKSDDWTKIHSKFENTVNSLRTIAPIVAIASSSDRSMDQVAGELSLTPDMPGRQAAGIAGMIDFVFVVRAQALNATKVKRWIDTAPSANTIIRQRLPKPLPSEIEIPEGGGGWKKLVDEMQKCLDKQKEGK